MIYLIAPQQVDQVWLDVEPLLRPVLELPACRCTLPGTYHALRDGSRQLFVAFQNGTIVAAAVTCVTTYDVGDWLTVILCGGRMMEEWGDEGKRAIEALADECGCQGVEIWGREGWVKALGYEKTGTMIQKVFA